MPDTPIPYVCCSQDEIHSPGNIFAILNKRKEMADKKLVIHLTEELCDETLIYVIFADSMDEALAICVEQSIAFIPNNVCAEVNR